MPCLRSSKTAPSPAVRSRGRAVRPLAPVLFLAAHAVLAADPPPNRTVAVTAVDRIGRPVKDVSACLLPACAKVALRPGKDRFVAEVPATGAPVTLRVTARAFEPADVVLAPGAASVEATLKAKGSVRAVFLSPDEKRSEKLTVSLKETIDPKAGTRGRLLAERTTTLAPRPSPNAVVLEDVPPGDWVLSWEGPSLAAGGKLVKVGETPVDAGSTTVAAGRSVAGAVRDDLGSVVPGARVRLCSGPPVAGRPGAVDRSTLSGSDGSFTVTGLPVDESFAFSASASGHEEARGTLGGETRLEVVLVRAQHVSGRLVDDTGAPLAGVPVAVTYVTTKVTTDARGNERRSTMVEGHAADVTSGVDGTFSFFRNLPASVRVEPGRQGLLAEPRILEPLGEEEPRGEADLGDLVVRKGRVLTGRVLRADGGAPVPGARLEASWKTDAPGELGGVSATSEADGSFRLTGILPGRDVTLTARRDGFSPRTMRVETEADSVDVLLGRGGRVTGRACGTAWEIASMAIWYGQGGGFSNQNQAEVDASGGFVLENAEAGTLTFVRSWRFRDPANPDSTFDWSGQVRAAVEVKEGETAQVSLGCDGIRLSGVVTRGGRPVASEVVGFSLEGSPSTDALTDSSGTFSTRVPAPGRWLLSSGGSPFNEAAGCEVPPGGLEGCRVELAPAGE
ncbi:MAG: carboxypeptidase-like regulatory domain-containing protein [Thermoanaerobaculia bacterium]